MDVEVTAVIERDGDGFVSLCPELNIASQGDAVQEARENLIEALEGFALVASEQEIRESLQGEVYVTRVRVALA